MNLLWLLGIPLVILWVGDIFSGMLRWSVACDKWWAALLYLAVVVPVVTLAVGLIGLCVGQAFDLFPLQKP